MTLTRKVRDWWGYLKSLNEVIDHSQIIILEASLGSPAGNSGLVESLPKKIPSDYNFYVYQIAGACEFVASVQPGAQVMDPAYRNPHLVTVQVNIDRPEQTLFSAPITLSQITGPDLSTFEPIDLPHPWRLQNECTVQAVFTARNGFPTSGQGTLKVCIALIGEQITQNALDMARKAGIRMDGARLGNNRIGG